MRYRDNPTALNLRAMNMVYEGLRQKGAMILVPSSALESMNLGTVMGERRPAETHGPGRKGRGSGRQGGAQT